MSTHHHHHQPTLPQQAETVKPLKLIGQQWSRKVHVLQDLLTRNFIPFTFIDYHHKEANEFLQQHGKVSKDLPILVFPDDSYLLKPTINDIALKLGARTRSSHHKYDLVIVGGGPAGLAAAVYGSSEGLNTLLIEREAIGGQAATSAQIDNYLGFPEGISGQEFAKRALEQACRFGVEILLPAEVVGLHSEADYHRLVLTDATHIHTRTVLLATGVDYHRLQVPGADRFTWRGVYYGAAVSEGVACRDQPVVVVGGGNSAGQAAMHLSKYASQVILAIRGEGLEASMSQYLIEEIQDQPNIKLMTHTQVKQINGNSHLRSVDLFHTKTGETVTLPAIALFVYIGASPHTDWLSGVVKRDDQGFIVTGSPSSYLLATNIPGIFAAGDVRANSTKRIASAIGAGAMAIQFVHQYLNPARN